MIHAIITRALRGKNETLLKCNDAIAFPTSPLRFVELNILLVGLNSDKCGETLKKTLKVTAQPTVMEKLSRQSSVLVLLSGVMALTTVACTNEQPKTNSSSLPQPSTIAAAPQSAPPAQNQPIQAKKNLPTSAIDTYELALDKAASAASLSKAASSTDDWKIVSSRWTEAIKLLKAVPAWSKHKQNATTKLAEYQKNLAAANRKANPPSEPVVAYNPNLGKSQARNSTPKVFRAPIIGRLGGTPVILVTFNNGQKFPMILDTGASGVVITSEMAAVLGVRPVGKVIAKTPSDKAAAFDVGFVDSIAVGGAVMTDVPVAIAPQLDIGLLGQDFFASYDVTIRSNVVEFHVR